MVCMGLEPEMTGWLAQTNPLSYGGTLWLCILSLSLLHNIIFSFKFDTIATSSYIPHMTAQF